MNTAVEALIKNKEHAIVIFASLESIAAERARLEKWRRDELAAIPRRAQLVSEQMGGTQASRAAIAMSELLPAKTRAAELLKRYGAPLVPLAIELLDRIEAENRYLDRLAELNRLQRRSAETRFTMSVPARPVPRSAH